MELNWSEDLEIVKEVGGCGEKQQTDSKLHLNLECYSF